MEHLGKGTALISTDQDYHYRGLANCLLFPLWVIFTPEKAGFPRFSRID